jgi:hypothetical protein
MSPFYKNSFISTLARTTLPVIVFLTTTLCANAQLPVTGIITDYNGYWKTSVSSISPTKPANDHNVIAFTCNGVQYSTGVNDGLLSSHGESFVAGDFWALPVEGFSGTVTSNTKIGLGEKKDGVHAGRPAASPSNNIPMYLTDGIKGLNIGTCVANIPAGALTFLVSDIKASSIGDGIPDILVTQVADPGGSSDRYFFLDQNGNTIGTPKDVVFTSIAPIANWTADFYNAATNPMTLDSGFMNTDRPMRLWAADLADFGITAANFNQVRKFRINLSGNSDVAFAAYNNKTFSLIGLLPVTLTDFTAKPMNGKTQLNWTTGSEINSQYFIVERSTDNGSFRAIDTVAAAGNSAITNRYSSMDASPVAGNNYYRLKMVDQDGYTEYSKTIRVQNGVVSVIALDVYPNPATDKITIRYSSTQDGMINVFNAQGVVVKTIVTAKSATQTTIDLSAYAKGFYYVVWESGEVKCSGKFVKQ